MEEWQRLIGPRDPLRPPVGADSHNHLQVFRDPGEVVRAMRAAGVAECVVNSTSPADWAEVEALALAWPGFVRPAFGIHPWLAHTAVPGWREQLLDLLDRHPAASLGECGLDGSGRAPPLATQAAVFEAQLELARELRRPVTIHCVRAWGVLFELFGRTPPPARLLLHSFQGSAETAARLVAMGACCSLPARAAPAAVPRLTGVFRTIPRERILLESDAPGLLPPVDPAARPVREAANDPARLPELAQLWAGRLGWPANQLLEASFDNHRRCFGES